VAKGKVLILAVGWVVSLVTVGGWAQAGGGWNIQSQTPNARELRPGDKIGDVITGPDIGFQRVVGQTGRAGSVSGYFVVRVNGEWLMATAPMTVRPLGGN
jgi:hypothetical protein